MFLLYTPVMNIVIFLLQQHIRAIIARLVATIVQVEKVHIDGGEHIIWSGKEYLICNMQERKNFQFKFDFT